MSRSLTKQGHQSLAKSVADFQNPTGAGLVDRIRSFEDWRQCRIADNVWPYSKSTDGAPLSRTTAKDSQGNLISGVNFGSQDYLNLSSHPEIKKTAKSVIDEFGVHSAGSSALMGNTKFSLELEARIAAFTGYDHALLFPTGWAAGYGIIRGLVRQNDYVVIDQLAHACLQEGAASATSNIIKFRHIDNSSAEKALAWIKKKDRSAGVLVVTESLFSMDSDTPDIGELQDICRSYGATLVVDAAHDLGNLGATGRGHLENQGLIGKIDILMGSFSKTFASNGGFVATNAPHLTQYLKFFCGPQTFSNAMSPVQCATVAKAFEIVDSTEGVALRTALMDIVVQTRSLIKTAGFKVLGSPSAIIPVVIGDVDISRVIAGLLPSHGVIANLVEYPAVPLDGSRIRLQAMSSHTLADAEAVVAGLRKAAVEGCQLLLTEA